MTIGLKQVIPLVVISWVVVGFLVYKNLPTAPKAVPLAVAKEKPLNAVDLWEDVQNWRKSVGLIEYKKSDFLCSIADVRIVETEKNFSHDGFSADRFCKTKCVMSENLVKVAQAAAGDVSSIALNQWLNSPEHLKDLQTPYTHSCIRTDGLYAVQIFGYY